MKFGLKQLNSLNQRLQRVRHDRGWRYVVTRSLEKLRGNVQSRILRFFIANELKLSVDRSGTLSPQIYRSLHRALPEIPLSDDPAYYLWLIQHHPRKSDLQRMQAMLPALQKPLISIVMPVYNPPVAFLTAAIESVLAQVYPHWELCIADDASPDPQVKAVLDRYAAQDNRIRVLYRTENGHISECSNSALKLARGEFVALLDHDDVLTPDALYEVVSVINQQPEVDMMYSDEDKLDARGYLNKPFFKPDWCPDSFLCRMYTCHLGIYRRYLLAKIGGFRVGYEGSQDYDLVLRFTEQTHRIVHIPKVLYHWRVHPVSAASGAGVKPYAYEAARKALSAAIERRGEPGTVVETERYPGHYLIRYEIQAFKKISIIILTKNLGAMLDRCLTSIFTHSHYPNYEVIVIDNHSTEATLRQVLEKWLTKEPKRFQTWQCNIPFNYAQLNNAAVAKTTGDYLLFLNNDTEVITPDWLEAMVEQAQRPSIGAVGAMLLYPDQTIQHAGILLGVAELAGHSHRHFHAKDSGYCNQIQSINNYSAVTAACLMCRRDVFTEVGGFNEALAIAYNDVDLCLKFMDLGYRNIYLPHVQLFHYESQSRGYDTTIERRTRLAQEATTLRRRWSTWISNDPCYSPHLTRRSEDYRIRLAEE
jgi:O-antigen biosynthesis protein